MKLIDTWWKKQLRCFECGSTKSVKYEMTIYNPVIDNKPTTVCVCNKCARTYTNLRI
jgi:hypothetical protein